MFWRMSELAAEWVWWPESKDFAPALDELPYAARGKAFLGAGEGLGMQAEQLQGRTLPT